MTEFANCTRCGNSYPFTEEYFCKDKSCINGLSHLCKLCRKEKNKKYYEKRKEKVSSYHKEYYSQNKDKIKERAKVYYGLNKEVIIERNTKYNNANKGKHKLYAKKWYENHREEWLRKCKEYGDLPKTKEHKKGYLKNYYHSRIKNDDLLMLSIRLRSRIRQAFKQQGYDKKEHTYDMIGLPPNELRYHLLQTYKKNYGAEWDGKEIVHIDHIIPLSSAKTEDEMIALCHYSNLQLLKAKDNQSKGAKLNFII